MNSSRAIWAIMAALLAWGIYLGIGAYLNFEHTSNPWRMVVVLGSVLLFLAFWGMMLAQRKSRLRKQNPRRLGPRDAC